MTGFFLSRSSLIMGIAVTSGLLGLAACASGAGHGGMSPAQSGLSYARQACASCHAVELGEALSPNVAAPSFQTLASRPDMSRAALSALLRSPHRNMPSLIVEPDRVDDLAAYLYALQNGE